MKRLHVLALLASAPALAQTAFVNFETPPVHAMDITPDGSTLLVVNTPDARLEVFSLAGALPVWVRSIPVGLEPVSVRARTNGEAWVVNRLSDDVSIINLATANVTTTLPTGDEPGDVVFAGSPTRAFVSVTRPAQILIFDPANLASPPSSLALVGSSPRAMTTDATRLYVSFFENGNRTTIAPASVVSSPSSPFAGVNPPPNSGGTPGTFSPPLTPGLPIAPAVALIMNKEGTQWKDSQGVVWDPLITWGQAEHGVAIVNLSTLAISYASGQTNIQGAIAINPSSGLVTIAGTHLTNYHRFETGVRGDFARHAMVTFNPASPPTPANGFAGEGVRDINGHLLQNGVAGPYIASPTPAQVALSLCDPRALVWTPDGSAAYIAGAGSANVVRMSATGTAGTARLATINVGQGPSGLALDTPRSRLYCLNRFDATISVISTASNAVLATLPFFDPTTPAIKAGRPLLYDAHQFSKYGHMNCASCHVDGRTDISPWDLGDPSGSMKSFDQTCGGSTGFSGTCNDWHPLKGPMVTQTLFGIVGNGPMHWRGDRTDLSQFSVGYTGLLGRASAPTPAEMALLTNFVATLTFPPNPNRTITDGLPASAPGSSGSPASGQTLFSTPALFAGTASCVQCHSSPTGGNIAVIPASVVQDTQGLKVPHFRDLYTKTGFSFTSQSNVRPAGFTHDGTADTIANYLKRPKFTFPAGAIGDQQRADLESFLICWPTGTHPAVGRQITFTGANNADPTSLALLATLQSLADQNAIGLVARGVVGGLPRGYVYLANGLMQSDRRIETITLAALRSLAASGAEITFTAVPVGTQVRAGVDRDADGWFDRDELDLGSNPGDASSVPSVSCVAINTPPAPITGCPGGSVSFTASATGTGPLAYQWRRAGVPLVDGPTGSGSTISGSATPTLTLTGLGAADQASYDVLVTNACGSAASASALLTFCYANCDCSSGTPALSAADFSCFLTRFRAGDPYANCDGSTGTPSLTAADFSCFLSAFRAGCP